MACGKLRFKTPHFSLVSANHPNHDRNIGNITFCIQYSPKISFSTVAKILPKIFKTFIFWTLANRLKVTIKRQVYCFFLIRSLDGIPPNGICCFNAMTLSPLLTFGCELASFYYLWYYLHEWMMYVSCSEWCTTILTADVHHSMDGTWTALCLCLLWSSM